MISVIIPVYNVEKYLYRCIDSIINQKNVEIELILVDDGSTDKSGEICDSYRTRPNVIVHHQDNNGVSSARNQGIRLSKGEYLLFVDSDDWLAENALSELLSKGRNADIVMFGSFRAKEERDSFDISQGVFWENVSEPYEVRDKYIEILGKNVTLWNKLINRNVIGDFRFNEDMTYGEDADFLCRILQNVQTAVIVPELYYYYYINRDGSVVASSINPKSLELIKNTKQFYSYLSKRGHDNIAMKRICVVSNEILGKIPLMYEDIKKNWKYIQAVRELLKFPSIGKRICFYFDKTIEKNIRFSYFRMSLNPLHMYYRLLRNRKRKEGNI